MTYEEEMAKMEEKRTKIDRLENLTGFHAFIQTMIMIILIMSFMFGYGIHNLIITSILAVFVIIFDVFLYNYINQVQIHYRTTFGDEINTRKFWEGIMKKDYEKNKHLVDPHYLEKVWILKVDGMIGNVYVDENQAREQIKEPTKEERNISNSKIDIIEKEIIYLDDPILDEDEKRIVEKIIKSTNISKRKAIKILKNYKETTLLKNGEIDFNYLFDCFDQF